MAGKVAEKYTDTSKEALAKFQPLCRKSGNIEIVPKILTNTPKSAEKNMKNSAITSFHGEQSAHPVSKQDIEWFSWKKMPNIDPNWGT